MASALVALGTMNEIKDATKIVLSLLQELKDQDKLEMYVAKIGAASLIIGGGAFVGYKAGGGKGALIGTASGIALAYSLGLCDELLSVMQKVLSKHEINLLSKAVLRVLNAFSLPPVVSAVAANPAALKKVVETISEVFEGKNYQIFHA